MKGLDPAIGNNEWRPVAPSSRTAAQRRALRIAHLGDCTGRQHLQAFSRGPNNVLPNYYTY